MENLQITVVLKSDLAGFTRATGTISPSELEQLLADHLLVARAAFEPEGGAIVKGEGDAFWVTFPSVAGAVRAAESMRRELHDRATLKPDTGLRARFAITVGDVLRQDADIFGPAVNLAARIEAITPPDAIHLDDAAWAALGDREFTGEVVATFVPKGFSRSVTVYKVEPHRRVRRSPEEVVMFTDMSGYTEFVAEYESNLDLLETTLLAWEAIHQDVADFGGRVRINLGDAFMVMLPTVDAGVEFFGHLHRRWSRVACGDQRIAHLAGVRASLNVGHYLRVGSTVIGRTINDCARAMAMGKTNQPGDGTLILTAIAADQASRSTIDQMERVPVTLKKHHTLGSHVHLLRLPPVHPLESDLM